MIREGCHCYECYTGDVEALRAENVTLRADLAVARDELAIANALSNRRGW